MQWFESPDTVVRRWTPKPAAQVTPVRDGSSGDNAGQVWCSEGDDPQFHIVPEGQIAPGWYRAQAKFAALSEQRLEPCIYVDYGSGVSEGARFDLPYTYGSGALDCVFHLQDQVRMLRFDPMSCEGCFALGEIFVRRISPREALWRMLRSLLEDLRRRQPAEAARIAMSASEARKAGGVEHALDWLWPRYQESGGAQDALYRRWIDLAEECGPVEDLLDTREHAQPMFTIVHIGGSLASEGVDHLLAQSFTGWELLYRSVEGATPVIDRTDADRVRHFPLESNLTAWLRRAVSEAKGRFIVLLPDRCRLHVHALTWFAASCRTAPSSRLLYGDEDFVDDSGERHTPWFKPDWNPELALAQDYFSGAMAVETGLLREILEQPLTSGAEAYDLALRCAERLNDGEITHVPRIVRHNLANDAPATDGLPARAGAATTVHTADAVNRHLSRRGIDAVARATGWGVRVDYALPADSVAVDIIVPTRDRTDLLAQCIESVLDRTTWRNYNITVVDNGSKEPQSIEYLSGLSARDKVRVLAYDKPFNYSAINNFAAARSAGDILVLLNNDIEVITPEWLSIMVSIAIRQGVGAVGAKLYYPDDTVQHAGVILGVKGVAAHQFSRQRRDAPGYFNRAQLTQNMSAVTAACLAVRKQVFDEVGGLDESIAVAFNDIDFCLRVQERGYRNVWTPYAELYHHESASRGYEDNAEKQARFASEVEKMQSRWGKLLQSDPAYNPNLGLNGRPFEIDPSRTAAGRLANMNNANHADQ